MNKVFTFTPKSLASVLGGMFFFKLRKDDMVEP